MLSCMLSLLVSPFSVKSSLCFKRRFVFQPNVSFVTRSEDLSIYSCVFLCFCCVVVLVDWRPENVDGSLNVLSAVEAESATLIVVYWKIGFHFSIQFFSHFLHHYAIFPPQPSHFFLFPRFAFCINAEKMSVFLTPLCFFPLIFHISENRLHKITVTFGLFSRVWRLKWSLVSVPVKLYF